MFLSRDVVCLHGKNEKKFKSVFKYSPFHVKEGHMEWYITQRFHELKDVSENAHCRVIMGDANNGRGEAMRIFHLEKISNADSLNEVFVTSRRFNAGQGLFVKIVVKVKEGEITVLGFANILGDSNYTEEDGKMQFILPQQVGNGKRVFESMFLCPYNYRDIFRDVPACSFEGGKRELGEVIKDFREMTTSLANCVFGSFYKRSTAYKQVEDRQRTNTRILELDAQIKGYEDKLEGNPGDELTKFDLESIRGTRKGLKNSPKISCDDRTAKIPKLKSDFGGAKTVTTTTYSVHGCTKTSKAATKRLLCNIVEKGDVDLGFELSKAVVEEHRIVGPEVLDDLPLNIGGTSTQSDVLAHQIIKPLVDMEKKKEKKKSSFGPEKTERFIVAVHDILKIDDHPSSELRKLFCGMGTKWVAMVVGFSDQIYFKYFEKARGVLMESKLSGINKRLDKMDKRFDEVLCAIRDIKSVIKSEKK